MLPLSWICYYYRNILYADESASGWYTPSAQWDAKTVLALQTEEPGYNFSDGNMLWEKKLIINAYSSGIELNPVDRGGQIVYAEFDTGQRYFVWGLSTDSGSLY